MTRKIVVLAAAAAFAFTAGVLADSSGALAQTNVPQAIPQTAPQKGAMQNSRDMNNNRAPARSQPQRSSGSMGGGSTASGALVGSTIPADCARIQNNAAELQACFDKQYRSGGQQQPR